MDHIDNMSRTRVGKDNASHFVKEHYEKEAQNCNTKLEELRLEPFLICCPATIHASNNLTDVGECEKMATRWGTEVERGLVGDIIE